MARALTLPTENRFRFTLHDCCKRRYALLIQASRGGAISTFTLRSPLILPEGGRKNLVQSLLYPTLTQGVCQGGKQVESHELIYYLWDRVATMYSMLLSSHLSILSIPQMSHIYDFVSINMYSLFQRDFTIFRGDIC